MKRVLMSDELFQKLGASRVDWGEPGSDGFYTPTVYDQPQIVFKSLDALVSAMNDAQIKPSELTLGHDLRPVARRIARLAVKGEQDPQP